MPGTYNILFLGAAYGSLLASKLLFGGHSIKLVCLPAEADAINQDGIRVRLPIRGRKDLIELNSQKLPGKLSATGPAAVNPADFDLVALAMQEPQYRSPGVRELLDAVAKSRVPCMSIMNMPPLPYVKRIPGLDYEALKPAYTDPSVWDSFDPATITLNSPDPQAIRPPDEKVNVLLVTLPTNFKVARFVDDKSTAILRQLQDEIEAIRYDTPEGKIELPVKLKVYDSIFVPLAKWAMLLAGNYRCVTKDGMRTAQEAVHSDIETSRSVYNFVFDLCVKLGAKPRGSGAVREIRRRRAKPHPPGLRGARAAERRPQYRARRQAGAAHRQAEGPEPPRHRRHRRPGRRAPRRQPQEGRGVTRSTAGITSPRVRGEVDARSAAGEGGLSASLSLRKGC